MPHYLGMDVHRESCTIVVLDASGRRVRRDVVETKADSLREYMRSLPPGVHGCIEEGEWSEWLFELLSPFLASLVSVPGHRSGGPKSDALDAYSLADRLRTGQIKRSVYKAPGQFARLRELARVYGKLVDDSVRTKNRLGSLFRRRGISYETGQVYSPDTRAELLVQLPISMHSAVELLGAELDAIEPLRAQAKKWMVQESHRYPISRILETAPGLGLVRVAQLMPIVITPNRFRTKRQFWSYCGLAVKTVSTGDWVMDSRHGWTKARVTQTRGLNRQSNRDLKKIFKGAAQTVLGQPSDTPLRQGYERCVAGGTKPNLARLTLARRIAAITLAMWKRQERFDPSRLSP